jgi:PAS domain S-box-containing protein
MKKPLRVLLVEDSEDDALLLLRELRHGGYDPVSARVDTAAALAAALEGQVWDVIISDYRMPNFTGLVALRLVQARGLDVPFILVSGAIGEEVAVAAMKTGANDYLLKGNLARLAPAVDRELRDAEARRQHRRGEETLRESEQRFRLLVDATPDYAIFMLDPAGRIASWNTGARRIKGYEAEEIVGKHFSCFYPKEAVESGWPAKVLNTARAEGRFEEEGWRLRKNGSRFWANTVISALRDEAGNLKGYSKITRDLTEQKRIEDQIRKLNRELESRVIERTAELRAAVDALEAEVAERRRLEHEILQISEREQCRVGQDLHDGICQELAGLGFLAEGLKRNLAAKKLAPAAASADAEKIEHFIRGTLRETHNLARCLYPVRIEENGLMSALEELATDTAHRFHITCKFKCPKPVVMTDNHAATHVFRIAQEAAGNAIRHGKAGLVVIKIAATGKQITLTVEDNGEGQLKKINRSGMGMKTMSYRARSIGGQLEIRQRPQHGLAVKCTFPSAREKTPENGARAGVVEGSRITLP